VPVRDDYKRHEHVGLNVFLLEMFNQFPEVLGVAKKDYMTSATNGVDLAIENMIRQGQRDTLDVSIANAKLDGQVVSATVNIRNKAGHRFPSGVAFRRAFIEFTVRDGNNIVWSSGRTNEIGVILDGKKQPLPSEFLPDTGKQRYQRHYQTIDSEDQVQIYEELNKNAAGQFTSSFIHRVEHVKDNRLLPKGWRESSHFKPEGEATQRLYFLASRLDLKGTPMADWKLRLASADAKVKTP
jgi:hypothetical protein